MEVLPDEYFPFQPPVHMDYHSRLASFYTKEWRGAVSPVKLAKAGFAHTGLGDRTECVFCKGVLFSWKKEDDPETEHKKYMKNCLYTKAKASPAVRELLEEGLDEEDILQAYFKCANATPSTALRKELNNEKVSHREDPKCRICLDLYANVLFLPCKHLITCSDCAYKVDTCPICRSTIVSKMPVFT